MYSLPNFPKIKSNITKVVKNKKIVGVLFFFLAAIILTIYIWPDIASYFLFTRQKFYDYLKINQSETQKIVETLPTNIYISEISYEQAIIDAAKKVSPSVVSIVISKDLPVYEQELINPLGDLSPFSIQIPQYVQKGTKYQEVGAGSGFIITSDGLVLTNKHVVSDTTADYTVLTNDGKKYDATVLALDPMQDLAIIKMQSEAIFTPVILGDSAGIQIGQTAIAIGNALGEFSNTVSVGVVSGLGRTISASNQANLVSETLENIIQTDAAINSGNSGGPLLNLKGEVIGINTAMADGAQAIGFAIPINMAKRGIEQIIQNKKIVYPFLGVRYTAVNEDVKSEYNLSVDYGALILNGSRSEPAITPGSAAERAGLKNKDVILEINSEKITFKNSLSTIIRKYNAGDEIILRILRDGEEQDISVILGEKTS